MKTLKIAVTALLLIMAMGCKEEKKSNLPTRQVEVTDPNTGVITLRDYTIADTIAINGKVYDYSCRFEPVDSMPILINPQGLEYKESRVSIEISHDSTKVFGKTFYKKDFSNIVPADFLKSSTVVGVNYNYTKRDIDRSAFYFIITVGDPDETSDMSYPIELKVDPNGTFTLKKAENLETGPITQGLNIDPSEDAV